jgi:hypothetical protein
MESDTTVSSKSDDDDNELLEVAEVLCVAEAVLAWRTNRVIWIDCIGNIIIFRCSCMRSNLSYV